MDDFIKNLQNAFNNEMKVTPPPSPTPKPTPVEDNECTTSEDNFEVVSPDEQETPEGSDEDDMKYDSDDGSEWIAINTSIKTMYACSGVLLFQMMVRDYGIFIPFILTMSGVGAGYLSMIKTQTLINGYGKVRQKIDHGLEFIGNLCKSEGNNPNVAPESVEENIMMLQFKPENSGTETETTAEADSDSDSDDDEGPLSWTLDSVLEYGILFMITRENRKGTLNIRFKTGQTRTIILNA